MRVQMNDTKYLVWDIFDVLFLAGHAWLPLRSVIDGHIKEWDIYSILVILLHLAWQKTSSNKNSAALAIQHPLNKHIHKHKIIQEAGASTKL